MVNHRKKILVTGASGYLGAHISHHLCQKGFRVIGTYRSRLLNSGNIFEGIEMIQVDLSDKKDYSILETLENVDTIIHTVSLDHKQSAIAPVEDMLSINVMPTWRLLETFVPKGLKKFIYLSTIHVLGDLNRTCLNELSQTKLRHPYALTHLLSEDIVSYYRYSGKVEGISLRLSNGYGPPLLSDNNCWGLVVNDLCKTAWEQHKIIIQSDGKAWRDFIHTEDICRAIEVLIENSNASENCYNLSSGNSYSIIQLGLKVQQVYKEMYGTILPLYINKTDEVVNKHVVETIPYKIPFNNLKKLGYKPHVSLEEGIKRLFSYFEYNG